MSYEETTAYRCYNVRSISLNYICIASISIDIVPRQGYKNINNIKTKHISNKQAACGNKKKKLPVMTCRAILEKNQIIMEPWVTQDSAILNNALL